MQTLIDRRALLGAGMAMAFGGMTTPERLLAGEPDADWTLGIMDLERDVELQGMTLVAGRPPGDLIGTLYRNGPAKFRRNGGSADHWFDGDGLVRAFTLAGGTARLAARFVRTRKRRLEEELDAIVQPGFGTAARPGVRLANPDDANAANTSLMLAGAELWALWEAGSPYRIDPTSLDTGDLVSFGRDLAHMPFSAHPRAEPGGDIWNIGVQGDRAIIWRLDQAGRMRQSEVIALPSASYIHDFTATEEHIVLLLQPWIRDRETATLAESYTWRPQVGTKVLVLDKDDLAKRRTYELPAFFFFHLGDAWAETDGTIRFDACIDDDPTFVALGARALVRGIHVPSPRPVLAMISLPLRGPARMAKTGATAEFPSSDRRRAGRPRRFTAHVTFSGVDRPLAQGLGLWDWRREADDCHDFGAQQLVEEFLFVPRPGASDERDGWLVGTTLNLRERATELHVLNAAEVSAGPICTWRAGISLPIGFHGVFVSRT